MREIESYNPSARNIAHCLSTEYQWLALLKNKEKEYEPILDYLMVIGEQTFMDIDPLDSKRFQSNKIAEITGIKSPKIKKFLTQIYEDLLELNNSTPKLFCNGGIYHYTLHFYYHSYVYSHFNIWLPTPLAYLDAFEFYFISAKVRTGFFWVESIAHRHEYGKTVVDVTLKGGFSNRYRELLLAKAVFMNSITINEKYDLSDYQIDERLKTYARKEKL
jgi:hypothetical protein